MAFAVLMEMLQFGLAVRKTKLFAFRNSGSEVIFGSHVFLFNVGAMICTTFHTRYTTWSPRPCTEWTRFYDALTVGETDQASVMKIEQ